MYNIWHSMQLSIAFNIYPSSNQYNIFLKSDDNILDQLTEIFKI